jgi:hypothetical protein
MERENDKTVMGIKGSAPTEPVNQMEKSNPCEVAEPDQTASFTMQKRIKSTAYEVTVHFSRSSKETLNDKLLRLARNEILNGDDGQQ